MYKAVLTDIYDRTRLSSIIRNNPTVGPRMCNIHVNNICERKCNFCWYFSPLVSKRERPRQLPFDALKRLILDCARLKVQTINFEGGEITLYPHLTEAFKLTKLLQLKIQAYSHLAYPHTSLNPMFLADIINVNLSSSSTESYAAIHGNTKFNFVIKNIRLLKRLAKPPAITLTFIITEQNYQEISDYMELAARLQVDAVKFKLHTATEELKSLVISPRAKRYLQESIPRITKSTHKVKHNLPRILGLISMPEFGKNCFSLPRAFNHNDRHFYYKSFPGNKIKYYVAWFYTLIDERGRVIAPCDNVGVCITGNILKQPFRKIWLHSKKLEKIRRESMEKIDITKKRWYECRYCSYVEFNHMITSTLAIKD